MRILQNEHYAQVNSMNLMSRNDWLTSRLLFRHLQGIVKPHCYTCWCMLMCHLKCHENHPAKCLNDYHSHHRWGIPKMTSSTGWCPNISWFTTPIHIHQLVRYIMSYLLSINHTFFFLPPITQMLHGVGIFTYIGSGWWIVRANVGIHIPEPWFV